MSIRGSSRRQMCIAQYHLAATMILTVSILLVQPHTMFAQYVERQEQRNTNRNTKTDFCCKRFVSSVYSYEMVEICATVFETANEVDAITLADVTVLCAIVSVTANHSGLLLSLCLVVSFDQYPLHLDQLMWPIVCCNIGKGCNYETV